MREILIAILTSSLVASAIGVVIKGHVDRSLKVHELSLKHDYELKIIDLEHAHDVRTAELQRDLDLEVSDMTLRAKATQATLDQVSAMVYRSRNVARDLRDVGRASDEGLATVNEVRTGLEEALYEHRLELDRLGLFADVHRFKNHLRLFESNVRDRLADGSAGRLELDATTLNLFEQMDDAHHAIMALLAETQT